MRIDGALGGDLAFVAVVECAAQTHGHAAVADQHTAIAVIQAGRLQTHQLAGAEHAVTVIQRTAEVDIQPQIAEDLTAAVVHRCRVEPSDAAAGNLAVAVVQLTETTGQIARAMDHPLSVE